MCKNMSFIGSISQRISCKGFVLPGKPLLSFSSELFHPGELLRITDAFDHLESVFQVLRVYVHTGVENVA
jgi:hypothetical protein